MVLIEIMQTVVRYRSSPWKRAVETLLTRKKPYRNPPTGGIPPSGDQPSGERPSSPSHTLFVHGTYTVDTDGRTTPRPVPELPHGSDKRKGDSHEDGLPLGIGRPRRIIQPRAMGSRLSPTTRTTRGFGRICNQTGDNENHLHQNH